MEALARGDAIRRRRAKMKRRLKAAELSIAEVLDDPAMQSMRVFDLLHYLPVHVPRPAERLPRSLTRAPMMARRIINAVGLSQGRTVAKLTPRERHQVIALATERTRCRP